MKRYATYKGIHLTTPLYPDVRSRKGWILFYLKEVDKEIYHTFKQWINAMLWLGYLLNVTNKTLVYGKNDKTGDVFVIEICNNVREAEKFCESWGWLFDDVWNNYHLLIEDSNRKMFRVDIFNRGVRNVLYFDTAKEACEYEKYKRKKGKTVNILQLSTFIAGHYEIRKEL